MKHAKRIGSLICVIAICFTLMAAPSAHAVGALSGQAAGAFIGAGLVALNIVADIVIGSIGNYFGWQAHPTSTTLLQQDIQYTFPVASQYISDYMNASTVVVRQGVTTIDGVEYDEVFVEPGTFTDGLKTNLFDFKTKWNIISGQSGITLASGWGYFDGIPVYNVNGVIRTPKFEYRRSGDYVFGTVPFQVTGNGGDQWNPIITRYNYNSTTSTCRVYGNYPIKVWASNDNLYHVSPTGGSAATNQLTAGKQFIQSPFQYNYTSGVVPGEETDIPDNYGLSIQIPHDKLQTFYNTYPQYNVDNSVINIQQDQIDIDELTQAIFDQITSMEDIRAEWKAEEEPAPPEPEPPGPAEDVLTGVNTIIGQQNTQISQNQQDMQIQQQQLQQQQQQLQQQQQINQSTQSIKDSIEQITETPTSEDLPDFKFDLRELFPFCIPFDIYRLLSSFDAEPEAPHVQLPIVIDSINFRYNLDLDFSSWNPVAQAMRTAELIVYAIGLAWATGKVIKW